jgi:DNA-directed RNA polymerase subunit RPC12/RpoP
MDCDHGAAPEMTPTGENDDAHDDDLVEISTTDATEREYSCPECDCQLETTHHEEMLPQYRVDCPACGWREFRVAG